RRPTVDRVGCTLATFHGACPPVHGLHAGARAVAREVEKNLDELLALAELQSERGQIHALARFTAAYADAHASCLDERAARGLTRECHGDLRCEHVVLERPIRIVDCVEFDASLRTLDVADDLAFLVMDLAFLGGERFGRALIDGYRSEGGDCGPDSLVAFYAVHRALVRTKVLLVRAAQLPASSAERGHASAAARELLRLAERFAWRARLPLVVVVCGVPESGKSQLAASLGATSGLRAINSDLVRKQLAGLQPTSRAEPQHYSAQFNHATYAELGQRAAAAVEQDGGAIVDATFRHLDDRVAFTSAL